MPRDIRFKNRSGEKAIQAFLQEKRIEQQQNALFRRLDHTRGARLRAIDAEAGLLRETLASYGRGMTNLSSYFDKEKSDANRGVIWFPLDRSYTDWEPRPCWLGKHAINRDKCVHFPCRNFTSYHFIFRELPQWVLNQAEESVRRSKIREDDTGNVLDQSEESVRRSKIREDDTGNLQETCDSKSAVAKLPVLNLPEHMTEKEKKLKIIISKKRMLNELENKPSDRNINYGKPMPVRRLQRPVRPVVRRMDVRL